MTVERVDALVVGAGVVGLAVGRELASAGLDTVVVEAAGGAGQGVSARSSEVIHAGLYYPPGSLKARLCVRGRALLLEFCAQHGVPHRLCGKLVVATSEEQHRALAELQARADLNGVHVQAWTAARAQALEPALHCTAALWSPHTGIVDSHALMLALQGAVETAGGTVALRTRALGARFAPGQAVRVQLQSGDQLLELDAQWLINAAGLQACALARHFDGLPPAQVPRAHFAKGSYFTVGGAPAFRHLIYPAPVDAWLGVHVTLDMAGQLRFGPDLQWLDDSSPDTLDYGVDPNRAAAFEAAIRRYWPGLPAGGLQPAYSGIRPRIHGPGEAAPDFRVDGPGQHGVAGLVNLFGIESPGLTSALALAEHVLQDHVLSGTRKAAVSPPSA
jgi:L-2-hydroxyglutarate oxidase LhgO